MPILSPCPKSQGHSAVSGNSISSPHIQKYNYHQEIIRNSHVFNVF